MTPKILYTKVRICGYNRTYQEIYSLNFLHEKEMGWKHL